MAQGEQPRMVTPEAVALEFTTANVGSRILAFLIDGAIVGAVSFAGLFALAIADLMLPEWLVVSILVILVPGWYLGFFVVLFILLSRDNQRLGDILAGTLVLRERSGLPAPAPVSFEVPSGLEPYAAMLDVSALRIEEYQAVRTFLLRAPSLPPAPRMSLAVQLASPLVERLRPPPPPGVPPELFLHCVAAAYQRCQRPGGPAYRAMQRPATQAPGLARPPAPLPAPAAARWTAAPAPPEAPPRAAARSAPPPAGEGFSPPA